MRTILFFILGACLFLSCAKDSAPADISGDWTWTKQVYDVYPFTATPQSSGIREILSFTKGGDYTVTQNGVVTNTGTYKLTTGTASDGRIVPGIQYMNERVADSVDYYGLYGHNDSLVFSRGLLGLVGAGSRQYHKQ